MEEKLKNFCVKLFEINAIKFGQYKTKVGIMTPVYCDLRVIVSYPNIMKTLSELLIEKIKEIQPVNILCGVPYTALPIATAISLKTELPMVMRRKEAKSYGTKKLIEGIFKAGDKCLVIEDVVTSGSSILETVTDLTNEGIQCKDALVLLNREQGGLYLLKEKGITMHALLTLSKLLEYLLEAGCIDIETEQKVKTYISENQISESILTKNSTNRLHLTFQQRAKIATNPIAIKLFTIMAEKKTNLCVAADITDSVKLLNLAESVGPYICVLKTHIDTVEDFHINLIEPLKSIAKKHNFLLFEDRKFADIGKIVQLQYSKGMHQISSWANIVTAHSLTGSGVLDALKNASGLPDRGVFLLAETSASRNLITSDYTKSTVTLAKEYADLITGIVCQSPLFLDHPEFIQLTPGVHAKQSGDELGQQYNSPENVVIEKGADVAVVGRGITAANNVTVAAEKYRDLLWEAYIKRIEG